MQSRQQIDLCANKRAFLRYLSFPKRSDDISFLYLCNDVTVSRHSVWSLGIFIVPIPTPTPFLKYKSYMKSYPPSPKSGLESVM